MPLAPARFSVGPFRGMRYDSARFDKWNPELVYQAKNLLLTPLGAYARRPSDSFIDSGVTAIPQWVGVFERPSGTLNIAIINGEIYTVDNTQFTKVVSAANLATASITLDATTPFVFATTYLGTLVINDNTNRPFTWDGTSGAGGLTSLTAAPSKVYGKPTVYYGKVFFIKAVAATDRATIVWSEENSANTGYESGGFANAWTLSQSGPGKLVAIEGTNEALYYWRDSSIGCIRGAVTTDFVASGVHDDIHVGIGTAHPKGVTAVGGDILFLDQYARPWHLHRGGQLVPLHEQIQDMFDPAGQGMMGPSQQWSASTFLGAYNYAVFSIYDQLAGYVRFFVFDFATDLLVAEWSFDDGLSLTSSVHYVQIGRYNDGTRSAYAPAQIIVFRGRGVTASSVAYITPLISTSAQYVAASTVRQPTTWHLMPGPMGGDSGRQWRYDDLTVDLDVNGGAAAGAVTLAVNDAGDFSADATVGSITIGAIAARRRRRAIWGLARELRLLVPKVSGNDSLAYWAVAAMHVTAYPVPLYPAQTQ